MIKFNDEIGMFIEVYVRIECSYRSMLIGSDRSFVFRTIYRLFNCGTKTCRRSSLFQ